MPDPAPSLDTPPATPPAPEPAWYGTEPEIVGYLQNRGLHDKPVNEVALAAIQAHREAERLLGVPATQLLRLPVDPAAPEWAAVHERLGAPKDAAGYDFSGVKFSDGTDVEQSFVDTARNIAVDLHLPKEAAPRLASAIVKYVEGQEAAEATERDAALATARDALKANWGPNYEGNLFIAKQAAAALGVAPEAINALENVIGYDKTMEMLRVVGTKIGEDKFISNINPALPGIKTVEQAVEEKAALMRDEQWRDRYLVGGVPETRQMTALNTLISGASR